MQAYDTAGNQILSWHGTGYAVNRLIDKANELFFFDFNTCNPDPDAATYDAAGNMISLRKGGDTGTA